tara:strand:- start:1680 stop:1844 length:165 start_codon:yes stop_codon:yes gene_type:complete
MAKVQVFIPEPPEEYKVDSFRQINLALEQLQNQLNTTYQREQKNDSETFNYFLS